MRIEISLRDVFAAQRAQALKALLLLGCGLVAAGLIVWRSARRLGAPITSLADAARRLTRGELPASIPVTADGEIGYLQQGFTAAADALRNAASRLHIRRAEERRVGKEWVRT